MREWLLDYYGSSVFNTCKTQELPSMRGPPLEMHIDETAKLPIAHKARPVPLHWEEGIETKL